MSGIWKKTLRRFIHDFEGVAKDEEVAEISTTVAKMLNTFNLCAGEDDTEGPEVVPEELTAEELSEVDQECMAEEEARERELQEKDKKNPLSLNHTLPSS